MKLSNEAVHSGLLLLAASRFLALPVTTSSPLFELP